MGRIYQQTFVDTYTKVAFAKLYHRKTPITAADLLNDRVIPFSAGMPFRPSGPGQERPRKGRYPFSPTASLPVAVLSWRILLPSRCACSFAPLGANLGVGNSGRGVGPSLVFDPP